MRNGKKKMVIPRLIANVYSRHGLGHKVPYAFFISNKQMLSNTLGLNFSYLKIIHILHPRYHPKIIGHILKNKQKDK